MKTYYKTYNHFLQAYTDTVIQIGDRYIPKDPNNKDYQEFLELLAKGEAELVEPQD